MNNLKYLTNVTTLAFDESRCTGCGRCAEVCPHGVFVIGNSRVVVTDRDLCIECGACMMNCAFGAIDVRKGVGCAAAIITSKLRKTEVTCGCSGNDKGCCS